LRSLFEYLKLYFLLHADASINASIRRVEAWAIGTDPLPLRNRRRAARNTRMVACLPLMAETRTLYT
jgi:hypothetical protein